MTPARRVSVLTARGRAALTIAFATAFALLVGPAIPAYAAPAPEALPGPANLQATYNNDGFQSMTISWDAAPHPSADVAVEVYELRYVDSGGNALTNEYTAQWTEFSERSARLSDLGFDPTLVEVRAGYTGDSVSEWSQLEVTLGSLAHLSAEIDFFADESGTETTTLSSRLAFEAALANAKALVAGGTAVGAPVGDAYKALNAAAQDRVNYSGLVSGIAQVEADGIPLSTPALLLALSDALTASRALLTAATEDPAAHVTGEAIERNLMALNNAYYAAVEVAQPLAALLAEAVVWIESGAAADYTSYSRESVRAAITQALTALDDPNATSDSLSVAADTLESALAARVALPTPWVDALALYATLDTAAAEYTWESATRLESAYAAAVAADNSAGATTKTLTVAGDALSAAIDALVDLAPLRVAIASNDPVLFDKLLYSADSWGRYVVTYERAVRFLAAAAAPDATDVVAEDVPAYARTITNARRALYSVPDLALAPGLYVQVVDGMIHLSNPGGGVNFSSGQFGYVPTLLTPPVRVPADSPLQFQSPGVFVPGLTVSPPRPDTVTCEVWRRAPVEFCNRMASPDLPLAISDAAGAVTARAAVPTPTATVTAAAPVPAASGYIVVPVLAPTTPVDGTLDVTIALPTDALTGTLAFQYTYNGVYMEVAASIDIVPPMYVLAPAAPPEPAPAAISAPAAGPTQLAITGGDAGAPLGGALLLLVAGALLTLHRSRRPTRA